MVEEVTGHAEGVVQPVARRGLPRNHGPTVVATPMAFGVVGHEPFGVELGVVQRSLVVKVLACELGTLVSAFTVSVCGWADSSLAVKVLDCELGMLFCPFAVLVCPFSGLACALGMLVSIFAVSVCG